MTEQHTTSNRVTVVVIYYLPDNCVIGPTSGSGVGHDSGGKTLSGGHNGVPANHSNAVYTFDFQDHVSLTADNFKDKVAERLKDMAAVSAVSATAAYLFTDTVQNFEKTQRV